MVLVQALHAWALKGRCWECGASTQNSLHTQIFQYINKKFNKKKKIKQQNSMFGEFVTCLSKFPENKKSLKKKKYIWGEDLVKDSTRSGFWSDYKPNILPSCTVWNQESESLNKVEHEHEHEHI